MEVDAPPRPAPPEDLEALIKEARERQLHRRLLAAAVAAIATGLGLCVYAVVNGGSLDPVAAGPAKPLYTATAPCTPSQLAVEVGLQGATQSMLGGAGITNTSGTACALGTTAPIVRITWEGKPLPVQERKPRGRIFPSWPAMRVLKPGSKAVVFIQWWDWCGKLQGTGMRRSLAFALQFKNGPMLPASNGPTIGIPVCLATAPSRNSSFIYVSRALQQR